jgi:hypothetical protein
VGRDAVVSLLEKSEAECREWAREHANREDFVDHDASDWTDADTDSAVDEWVNDTGDDVAPDTAVFYPEVQYEAREIAREDPGLVYVLVTE